MCCISHVVLAGFNYVDIKQSMHIRRMANADPLDVAAVIDTIYSLVRRDKVFWMSMMIVSSTGQAWATNTFGL